MVAIFGCCCMPCTPKSKWKCMKSKKVALLECLNDSQNQHGRMKLESENKQIDFYVIVRKHGWDVQREREETDVLFLFLVSLCLFVNVRVCSVCSKIESVCISIDEIRYIGCGDNELALEEFHSSKWECVGNISECSALLEKKPNVSYSILRQCCFGRINLMLEEV